MSRLRTDHPLTWKACWPSTRLLLLALGVTLGGRPNFFGLLGHRDFAREHPHPGQRPWSAVVARIEEIAIANTVRTEVVTITAEKPAAAAAATAAAIIARVARMARMVAAGQHDDQETNAQQ
jgi:hypothetical protein